MRGKKSGWLSDVSLKVKCAGVNEKHKTFTVGTRVLVRVLVDARVKQTSNSTLYHAVPASKIAMQLIGYGNFGSTNLRVAYGTVKEKLDTG